MGEDPQTKEEAIRNRNSEKHDRWQVADLVTEKASTTQIRGSLRFIFGELSEIG